MKGFFRLLSLLSAVIAATLVSCSDKDDPIGWVSFDSKSALFAPEQIQVLAFSSAYVKSYSVSLKPTGWADPVIDTDAKTVTITAPAESDTEAVKSGTVTIAGVTDDGKSVSASIFVNVTDPVDLCGKVANSYLINKGEANYLIDVMHKGDGATMLATTRVKIIWQTQKDLIQYLEFKNGKASFYVGNKAVGEVKEGNALIGAYDADGALIWSWHIWTTNFDPETAGSTVNFNGYTLMSRNLGALDNANSAPEIEAQRNLILASYGLYYQWGRKDPFIGPKTYQGVGAATMYSDTGSAVTMSSQQTNSERGTYTYTLQNPMIFITGISNDETNASLSDYDWLWPEGDDYSLPRWSETKTVNDPCPYGWHVAPAAAFTGLKIKETLSGSDYADCFGWTLTDGSAESLFIGAGRRTYRNGAIQNIYTNSETDLQAESTYSQPWIGFYWTTGVSESNSAALYFWFDKSNVSKSGIENAVPHYRSNGMQVRCVKNE